MEKLRALTVSLRFAEITKSKKLEGFVHLKLGEHYCLIKKYDEAMCHFKLCLTISKEIGYKVGEGTAYNQLGTCYICLSQYENAIKYHEMHLTIAKEIGHKKGEEIAYDNLGTCYICLSQYDKAINYQEIRLSIAREIGDKQGEGEAYANLGVCYRVLCQYSKAIEYQEMCLAIAKEIGDKKGEGKAYGNLGTCYRILGQYDKAIKYQLMYLNIAKEIRDKQSEGAAYCNLGTFFGTLGQYSKAIKYQKMYLTTSKEIGDKEGEGTAYGNLGSCYGFIGQYDMAIKYQEIYLTIAKEIRDKNGEGMAYGNLGVSNMLLGRYSNAIKYQRMQLTIAKEIGDKQSEGMAYTILGTSYYCLGQHDMAIKYQEKGLSIAKAIRNKSGEGMAYGNLGNCYTSLGEYDKAMKYHEMCMTIAKEIGDKKSEGTSYGSLGACYELLGQYDMAIEHQEMGLAIAKEIGDKKGEGTAYGNLGTCRRSLGQYYMAIEHQEMCLTIAKEIGDKESEGAAYGNLGTCYIFIGQYDKAIKYQEMCLTIAKEIGDKECEGAAYGNLGTCYLSLGQYDKAIKYQEIFLTITKEIGHKKGEGVSYANLGSCYTFCGQYDKAGSNFKKSVGCFERLFKNAPKKDEDKVSLIDTFLATFKELIQVLLAQEKRDEALITAERGRSRALVELMLTNSLDSDAFVLEVKVSNLHAIRKVVKSLGSTVLFCMLHVCDISTWIIQPNGDVIFQQCGPEVSEQSKSILQRKKYLFLLAKKVVELMRSCGTVKCEDRSLSFLYPEESSRFAKKKPELACATMPVDLTLPQQVTSKLRLPLPASMEELAKPTFSVRSEAGETCFKPEELDPMLNSLLKHLYQLLLEPIRRFVVGSEAIVVPEGPLALIPFAALVDENGHFVAESLRVSLVPSLTTAKMIQERPEEPVGQGKPLVIGDPDVGEIIKGGKIIPVARLSSAEKEVEVVGQFLHVEPLVGKRATKKRFLQKVERASLIHIAAHGDAERGEILLAPRSGTNRSNCEDIMLLISDLEHKRIKAKLVVLSSCYSGRGKVRGEGVVGIARAFLGAGARAVLVTLWAVDDDATLCFMFRFYEYLTSGDSAGEALNKAMEAIRGMKMFRHPRYWAPFVLLGEDVTPFKRKSRHVQPT